MLSGKPNLLVIITDHQRADSMGMRQCGREVMPRLNRFASEAACFTRAYTTSPLCIPARTAMATGAYPTRGIPINDFSGKAAVEQTLWTAGPAAAGYRVGYIGKNDIRTRPSPREQVGAGAWIDKADYEAWLRANGRTHHPGWENEAAFKAYYYKVVEEVLEAGAVTSTYSHPATGTWQGDGEDFRDFFFHRHMRAWLEARAREDAPFVGMFSIPSPHPPLQVPAPYDGMYDPDAIELPPNIGVPARGEPANRARCVARQLADDADVDAHRRAWAAHLGLLTLADTLFGEILDDLDRLGLAEDTWVVFTSDHGHHLGQHRMFGINELYEQTVHVPLVIRAPGAPARTIDTPVSHLDLAPTLLDAAGMEAPADCPGRSLRAAVVDGEPLAARPQYFQFSGQIGYGYYRRGLVTDRWKYIFDPEDRPELYDLDADPLEMENLAGSPAHREVLADCHRRCRAFHLRQGDWVRWPEHPRKDS